MFIQIKKLNEDAVIPRYQTKGSVGMDLHSIETLDIGTNQIKLVGTGIAVSIPNGYEAQIRPRSGLAMKGITIINAPGTIDSDYRGEIKVVLINFSDEVFHIENGDRIAQIIIAPITKVDWVKVDVLDPTFRGENGFGSTGIKLSNTK